MEEQDKRDLALWEFIDGTCSKAEHDRIAQLIADDAEWHSKYLEFTSFNASLSKTLEAEQPSMRFTKNVMEMVGHTAIAPSTNKYVNPTIIKGIAAFFLISIAVVTGIALFSIQWNAPGTSVFPAVHIPDTHIGNIPWAKYLSSTTIKIGIALNVLVGLAFVDAMLRKKSRIKHQEQ